mgnify:CR=1 FL=1
MIKQLLTVSFFVFLFFTITLYVFQRHLIYFPAKEMPSRKEFHAEDMQKINLKTKDGLVLNAWYKPASLNRPTLLYLHGNAGHIGYRMPLTRQFLSAGLGVLLLEYRGYGGNPGRPTEQGLYKDGQAAIQFLQQQGINSSRLALYGESLGTGVATKLATEYPVCALVLQSPFTSLPAVARYHYPWIFVPPWDKFDSLSRIGSLRVPLLIIHGKEDDLVPFSQGLALYREAMEPKKLLGIENKTHYDLWDLNFSNQVISFIKTSCS